MNTSWQKVSGWYSKIVSKEGHYYHQHVIFPQVLRLLDLKTNDSLLDLGCGDGVLGRAIPKNIYYQGIDLATDFINTAKNQDKNSLHNYAVGDVTKPLPISKNDFTKAAIILALQNIASPQLALQTAAKHLFRNGKLVIVLNHPIFRIPRLTSWGIDEKNKTQYRRINQYMTPLKIPINMHPGLKNVQTTWSFHFPLSKYSDFLQEAGFVIEKIEEWASDKTSVGKASKMENRARSEIPLFMAILAKKDLMPELSFSSKDH